LKERAQIDGDSQANRQIATGEHRAEAGQEGAVKEIATDGAGEPRRERDREAADDRAPDVVARAHERRATGRQNAARRVAEPEGRLRALGDGEEGAAVAQGRLCKRRGVRRACLAFLAQLGAPEGEEVRGEEEGGAAVAEGVVELKREEGAAVVEGKTEIQIVARAPSAWARRRSTYPTARSLIAAPDRRQPTLPQRPDVRARGRRSL
jgi:hypothetical protein